METIFEEVSANLFGPPKLGYNFARLREIYLCGTSASVSSSIPLPQLSIVSSYRSKMSSLRSSVNLYVVVRY